MRGENVLLLGEIDLDRDDDAPAGYVRGEVAAVHERVKAERKGREAREREKGRVLRGEGFVGEEGEGVL